MGYIAKKPFVPTSIFFFEFDIWKNAYTIHAYGQSCWVCLVDFKIEKKDVGANGDWYIAN